MTPFAHSEADPLAALYGRVRGLSLGLAAPLSDADATVQSMDDASPAKWHLAHTSWFFETFVLRGVSGYRAFDPAYAYLFNSYYEAEGPRHARPRRGMLTRPSLDEICAYRAYVDAALADALPRLGEEARGLVELGCHHEQQHQELLLTDLLHLFSQNPLKPAVGYRQPLSLVPSPSTPPAGVARDKLQPLAEVEGRGSELVTRPRRRSGRAEGGGSLLVASPGSATLAAVSPSTAKDRATKPCSNPMRWRSGPSPMANGSRSSRTAAIAIRVSGCPTAGPGCSAKASKRRFTGKAMGRAGPALASTG